MSEMDKATTEMTVADLHRGAMEAYDQAVAAEKAGNPERASESYRSALTLESEAAARVASRIEFEPTRSVLHRSAAAIALRCQEFRKAERLIAAALSGNPPDEIADELRELLDRVNFDRHMQLRGIHLASNEMQLSIAGNSVVKVAEKLLIRTIERKRGRPFRETGRTTREIAENYQLYLSAPRTRSFAVTLRVGLPEDQRYLSGMEDAAPESAGEVVQTLLECLTAYNEDQGQRLRELIPEESYRRNFVALARQLAPDGERVKLVGLTTEGQDSPRKVAMDRPRMAHVVDEAEKPQGEIVEVIGRLLFANSSTSKNIIKIVDDFGNKHPFVVLEGMMADIVKPLWEDRVRVTGVRKGARGIVLRDIDPIREGAKLPKSDRE
jgi:hypothetical protein